MKVNFYTIVRLDGTLMSFLELMKLFGSHIPQHSQPDDSFYFYIVCVHDEVEISTICEEHRFKIIGKINLDVPDNMYNDRHMAHMSSDAEIGFELIPPFKYLCDVPYDGVRINEFGNILNDMGEIINGIKPLSYHYPNHNHEIVLRAKDIMRHN